VVVEPGPGPARLSWPSTPAPGPLETAVGLVLAQAHPVRPEVWAALTAHLLGVDGGPPVPVADVAASVGRPSWWVRDLLPRVRMVARHVGPPASLVAAVGVLEGGPVRTAAEASAALVAAGVCAGPVHPGGVLRVAEVLGAECCAQLLTGEPGGLPVGGSGPSGPGVVAPAGRTALVRAVMGGVVAADRRGDVVDLTGVAAQVGVPVVAVRVVVEREPGWRTHHEGGGGSQGSRGSGESPPPWWAWRQPLTRKRGLVTSLAVRMLAVRAYDPGELWAAVVDVVDRLPPVTRRDAVVPPVGVLVAWLAAQDLLEPAPLAGGDAGAGVLRCPPGLALRSDVVLLEAAVAAGGTAEVGVLAAALRVAGYSTSTSTQLARSCPVLVRVGRGRYAPR